MTGADHFQFEVYVRPGSRTTAVGGRHDGVLVVRTAARPIDGRANDAVQTAIAAAFEVRSSAVSIVRGTSARRKRIQIEGDSQLLEQRLRELSTARST